MNVETMRESVFDSKRQRGALLPDTAYVVTDDYDPTLTAYGYSPDGEGVYWYTTMADLKAEHE